MQTQAIEQVMDVWEKQATQPGAGVRNAEVPRHADDARNADVSGHAVVRRHWRQQHVPGNAGHERHGQSADDDADADLDAGRRDVAEELPAGDGFVG